MDKQKRQERIEAFLRNELSAEEQERFRQELTEDEELASEVALHRMMQEEFGDREKQAFIQKLDAQSERFFNTRPPGRKKWRPWLIIFGGLLILLLGIWWFFPLKFNPPVELPSDEEVLTPSLPEEPVEETEETVEPIAPPTEEVPSPPIAQVDPADLAPNPYFENLIASEFRGEEVQFSDVNVWYSAGQIRVEGQIKKVSAEEGTLMIFVYSNMEQDYLDGKFLLSMPVDLKEVREEETERTAAGEALQAFSFSTTFSAEWKRGLYYYFLAWQRDEEPLYVGKFRLTPN